MKNRFYLTILILMTFLHASVISSYALAQDTERETQTLGRQFELRRGEYFEAGKYVTRFKFSPDGAETWCLAGGYSVALRGDNRGRALVFYQKTQSWENIPSLNDPASFHDVAFSRDGKTTWIAISSDEDLKLRIRERRSGTMEWMPFSIPMPDNYSIVKKLWLSPDGRDLWLEANSLIRADLEKKCVSQYVHHDFHQLEGMPHFTLVADYVYDVAFTPDSKVAICSATGGRDNGITKIELTTGKAKDFPVTDNIDFEHLVVSPDHKWVWCIGNNSYLWGFSIESETWTHKCSSQDGMPFSCIDALVFSPDSKYLWISGCEGVACYSIEKKKWAGFTTDKWQLNFALPRLGRNAPLAITSDGKFVITNHADGLALFNANEGRYSTIKTDIPNGRSNCSMIVPIPKSPNFLCVIEYKSGGGIFLLDMAKLSLARLFNLNSPVTAVAFSPSNNVWVAMPGFVYEIDISKERVVRQHEIVEDFTRPEQPGSVGRGTAAKP
jgi:DNA-binding beta-propeller fold protein YncE